MLSVQAKKAENRFRVRQGTKFYRVKCRPVDRERERGDQVSCDWPRAGHVTRCWCQAAGDGDELQHLGPDPSHATEPGHPAGGGGHRHDGHPGQPPAVCRGHARRFYNHVEGLLRDCEIFAYLLITFV